MQSVMTRGGRWGLALLASCALAAPSIAGIDDFTLLRGVPADAAVVVAKRNHDGLKFVNAQYDRVWEALANAGLEKELKKALSSSMPLDSEPEEFETQWRTFSDMLANVEWSELGAQESVIALRLAAQIEPSGGAPVEILTLFKPTKGKAKPCYESLAALMKHAATLNEMIQCEQFEQDGRLTTQMTAMGLPAATTLVFDKDVVLFSIGGTLIEESLGLLGGEIKTPIGADKAFKQTFAGLPAPEDELMYVDLARIIGFAKTVAMMGAAASGEDPADAEFGMKLLDEASMFSRIASVTSTKDKRSEKRAVVLLVEDAKSKAFYEPMFGNGPIENPLKFVPKNANSVTLNGGLQPLKFYQNLLKFIEKNAPEGEMKVAEIKAALAEAPFDVEKDLLAWLKGDFSYFSVPGKTAYSPSDSAIMLHVSDASAAKSAIEQLATWAEAQIGESGGRVSEVEVAEGQSCYVAEFGGMLAMLGVQPTVGVIGDTLYVANGARAVKAAIGAAKTGEDFSTSERYKEEGLPLPKNTYAFSFQDQSRYGEELSSTFRSVPMFLGLAAGSAGIDVSSNPGMAMIFGVLQRLAPVVQKLDFFQSTCSVTTFDGKQIETSSVTTYKEPPAPPTTTTTTAEESSEKESTESSAE